MFRQSNEEGLVTRAQAEEILVIGHTCRNSRAAFAKMSSPNDLWSSRPQRGRHDRAGSAHEIYLVETDIPAEVPITIRVWSLWLDASHRRHPRRAYCRFRAVMADSVLRALEMIIGRLPKDGNLAKDAAHYYHDICEALTSNSLTFCPATLSDITEIEMED